MNLAGRSGINSLFLYQLFKESENNMASQKVVVEGSSGVTASQLRDLFRQIGDGGISGKQLQLMLDHQNPWQMFGAGSQVQIGPLTERFEPERFFNNRKGLRLFNDIDRLGRHVGPMDTASMSVLGYADLTRDAKDREIRAELPKNHETQLWQIAKLIENQSNGEEGPLTIRAANVFYVSCFVVNVGGFFPGVNEWGVDAHYDLGHDGWHTGARVFYCN